MDSSEFNAKANLYEFVSNLRRAYCIAQYPIDTINICNDDDTKTIIMHDFSTEGFCAAAIPGKKDDTVILNSNRSVEQLNFDCGHEIIHLTKHRGQGNEIFTCFDKKQKSYIEWEANEGAAELLLPYTVLLQRLKENWDYLNSSSKISEFKQLLSQEFMLPPAVIELRIENLKYEAYQYIHGTPLNNIEILSNTQQRAKGIQIDSLNNIHRRYQAQDDFRVFIQSPV